MGRSSNSPPPKSAHKQPNVFGSGCEWLQWATGKIVISADDSVDPGVEDVSRFAEISLHSNLSSSYMGNPSDGYRAGRPHRPPRPEDTPTRQVLCLAALSGPLQSRTGALRSAEAGAPWPRDCYVPTSGCTFGRDVPGFPSPPAALKSGKYGLPPRQDATPLRHAPTIRGRHGIGKRVGARG